MLAKDLYTDKLNTVLLIYFWKGQHNKLCNMMPLIMNCIKNDKLQVNEYSVQKNLLN